MLNVENLTVRYGSRTVVDHVDFSLAPGQWLMLCGPNGAGKSTLVRAVAQVERYEGRVTLDGWDARKIKPDTLARWMGVLSQHNGVEYGFTVEEVVELGRYAYRKKPFSGEDGRERIEAALVATGLTGLREHSVLTLSGGEAQRAFLAQVFAQNPRLLILDEPANHLDLVYQRQVFDLIDRWRKESGRAVATVVHDLNLARRYGTHALLMESGRCVAQGETAQVLTEENLQSVYGMNVHGWMRELLSQWEPAAEHRKAI